VILYLDASALVKQYVNEPGSDQVMAAVAEAESTATVLVSRAEVSAALAKAVRLNILTAEAGATALQAFRSDWLSLVRIQMTELVVARADAFAWEYALRGYDAVHLAAASVWAEAMVVPVTFATFDRTLWRAARLSGLSVYPEDLVGAT
jgi:predicted nucleic acid-binding protein